MRHPLSHIIFSVISLLLLSFTIPAHGQERCGTVAYTKSHYANPAVAKNLFEQWLSKKMLTQPLSRNGRQQAGPYRIPVVVHIVHNGEAIGQGANITDAQVLSQIRVLNEDFRRENADKVNTPPEFQAVAGSVDIEFVLAKRDPDGLATNGIVRVNGGRSSWTMNNNYTLKDLSYWPAEAYMNIWVCNLTSHLGYAQFPESDLPGLENSSTNRRTDGIVIWYRAFGSADDGAFNLDGRFSKGRTATHETGHFFGLNHIWGDDAGCNQSDYVDDTPNQGDRTNGCPAHPRGDNCSNMIMFQNFLDYTDDACMNLFTQGQANRMITVIENSPRRASLLNAPGLQAPDPVPNDLGIRTIVFPDASVCSNQVTPVIEVRNYGSNVVTAASIRLVLDGTVMETRNFALNLDPSGSTQLDFNSHTIPSGAHDIRFQILSTNGGTDGGSYNDQKASTAIVPAFGDVPFSENFNTAPPGWIVDNPDGQVTWSIASAPNGTTGNKALLLNYYEYEDKIGEIDALLSPVLDFRNIPAAMLTFDVAHARYQSSNDRLRVIVLTDCQGYSEGTVVYDKAGDALKTASATSSPFVPASGNQWRRELVDLSAFIGADRVQLAFVGINDWGNNIYLDNVSFFSEKKRDVALARLVSPSVVTCTQAVSPTVTIQNVGSERVDEIDLHYAINGGPELSMSVTNLNLSFGGQAEITMPAMTLDNGANTLTVELIDPTGQPDLNPQNNKGEFLIVVNQHEDRIPLRQNFDRPFTPAWTVVSPTGGAEWRLIDTNFGQSLHFQNIEGGEAADEALLVSPVLDFSGATEASMSFDLAYDPATIADQKVLTILASTDCGLTYNEISYAPPTPATLEDGRLPARAEDWHTNVTAALSGLAGKDNVRIAFVARNENGSDVFLDNIEFFVSAEPTAVAVNHQYTIYGYDLSNPQLSNLKITFKLARRQDVRFSVISATGQMETDGVITDVLNQTFSLDLNKRLPPGVYFVRVAIDGRYYSSKILVY